MNRAASTDRVHFDHSGGAIFRVFQTFLSAVIKSNPNLMLIYDPDTIVSGAIKGSNFGQ